MSEPSLQPEPDDVLQIEPEGVTPPVDVAVVGVVRTQDLPRKGGAVVPGLITTQALAPGGTRLLRADHRRAIARINSPQAFYVAFTMAAAQDISRMAPWPANTVLTVQHDGEVWVVGSQAAQQIGAVIERWAEGE